MCVERRFVETCSPQNLQRALPGEMWTRCITISMSGCRLHVKREREPVGAAPSSTGKNIVVPDEIYEGVQEIASAGICEPSACCACDLREKNSMERATGIEPV